MRVLVWIAEGTWKAAVAAAKDFVPADADITLLHVVPIEPQAVVRDARHALLGRRHAWSADELQSMAAQVASGVLADAQTLLGRRAALDARRGRVGHEVVAAAQNMDLLVLARDCTQEGPPSLGPTARFVVDHSPCPLLLVWAGPNNTDAT
jgi:nucleotide-binding universal stress UspA family protein